MVDLASGRKKEMPERLTHEEIDYFIIRMKDFQSDESLPTRIRTNALKIEVCLLQMDIDLTQEEIKKHNENL